jgi:NAD(P)-dependent dehydrogenase (short-subunit alcohol dehydrogenase family)
MRRAHTEAMMQQGRKVAVFGASGGIGAALVAALAMREDVAVVHAGARKLVPQPTACALSRSIMATRRASPVPARLWPRTARSTWCWSPPGA